MTGFGRFPWIRTMMVGWLALGIVVYGHAQQSGGGSSAEKQAPANTGQKDTGTPSAQSATQPLSPAERKRAELLADTEKLYQLTQELKAEVAKSNKDTLSVSVVKKAQEVERLAKSIKERSRAQ